MNLERFKNDNSLNSSIFDYYFDIKKFSFEDIEL